MRLARGLHHSQFVNGHREAGGGTSKFVSGREASRCVVVCDHRKRRLLINYVTREVVLYRLKFIHPLPFSSFSTFFACGRVVMLFARFQSVDK